MYIPHRKFTTQVKVKVNLLTNTLFKNQLKVQVEDLEKALVRTEKGKLMQKRHQQRGLTQTNRQAVELRLWSVKIVKPKLTNLSTDHLLKSLFKDLSNNIMSAISHAPRNQPAQEVVQTAQDVAQTDSDNEVNFNNLFQGDNISDSEQENYVPDTNEEPDFDYSMPRVFEDDDKFGDNASTSIATLVENVCQKNSDVCTITK